MIRALIAGVGTWIVLLALAMLISRSGRRRIELIRNRLGIVARQQLGIPSPSGRYALSRRQQRRSERWNEQRSTGQIIVFRTGEVIRVPRGRNVDLAVAVEECRRARRWADRSVPVRPTLDDCLREIRVLAAHERADGREEMLRHVDVVRADLGLGTRPEKAWNDFKFAMTKVFDAYANLFRRTAPVMLRAAKQLEKANRASCRKVGP